MTQFGRGQVRKNEAAPGGTRCCWNVAFDQSCHAAASLFALRAGGEIEAAEHLARQEIKKTLPPTPDVGSRPRRLTLERLISAFPRRALLMVVLTPSKAQNLAQ